MKNKTKKRLYGVISLLVCMLMVVMNIHIVQVHAAEKSYQYCQTKTEKGVTFKVEWDEPKLGEETVFHLSATGGNASNKYYMTSPNYSNPGSTEREMLVDPTYSEWKNYTKECSTYDLKFKMTASGTYYFRFYVMNMSSPVVYFSIDVTISVSDADHPSVDSIVKSAVAQCNSVITGSDYDRALWLHDWLNAQIEYDNMHAWCSAEGALTRGLGTCEGYQRAYAKLLTAAGIPNERIEDRADNHTWNAVKLDGEWYQVDCTWDDTSEHWYDFDQRYMYFGLTDELMAIAHEHHADLYTTSGYQTRSTSLANNYLVRNGDAARWAKAYRARIQAKLDARETTFTIAADNSSYPPSYSGILNGITAYAINQMDWSCGNLDVSLQAAGSATQFTFRVSYVEEHTEHRWDAGTVTKAATCTQKGIRTYRCTAAGCKQTRTEELPALGHSMTRVVSERVAPTNQNDGREQVIGCSRCDYTEGGAAISKLASVAYSTHVQSIGWQDVRYNGTMAGTSGMAKRLEAIRINIHNESNLGIQYTTHCQTYGWLPWSSNGEMNGTEGEAKRLEAIKIQLTGADKDKYDVYYRVHAQSYGWLGWAKNGAPAGTAGYAKRLEGIQIVVVKRGMPAPEIDYAGVYASATVRQTASYIAKNGTSPVLGSSATTNANPTVSGENTVNVAYRTHVQTYGWQGWKYNGQMSGTSGQAKRLEGICIKLTNKPYSGNIVYTTHVQTYGWEGNINDVSTWKQNGVMSGTSGRAKRLEAICINLTGEMAVHYDVYYRVHAQTYGWLGWSKNGAPAGTAGMAKRLEGIQIVLVPKNGAAPSVNYQGIRSVQSRSYIQR